MPPTLKVHKRIILFPLRRNIFLSKLSHSYQCYLASLAFRAFATWFIIHRGQWSESLPSVWRFFIKNAPKSLVYGCNKYRLGAVVWGSSAIFRVEIHNVKSLRCVFWVLTTAALLGKCVGMLSLALGHLLGNGHQWELGLMSFAVRIHQLQGGWDGGSDKHREPSAVGHLKKGTQGVRM